MAYPWTQMNLIPLDGLEHWNQYEPGVSADGLINDYSGKGRHLTASSNKPVLTANVLNGQPGWYFNGSRNPLVYTTSSLALKHYFIVASAVETTFASDRGLVSGVSSGFFLTGQSSTNKFYDLTTDYGSNLTYKRGDVAYAGSAQAAPMSGVPYVMEISDPDNIGYNGGLQVGNDRGFTRLWYGHFFELLAYSTIKNDFERLMIYRYLAMRYNLWQKNSAGLNIFSFVTNKTRSAELDQEHYLSEPYSGDPKALVRGSFKRAFTLPFSNRTEAEFVATENFHKAHYPLTHFIYRDYRFYPARDSECRIVSPLREQGSDVSMRFNYSFDIAEVG